MMKQRIASVDILRGVTIVAMILVNTPGDWAHVYPPLLHAEWHGLTPTDLIFPFFLFIVGISIYFAYKSKTPSKLVYKKILVRSLKLIVLGLILNFFVPYIPFFEDLESVRIPGVLQRIGVVFLVSALLFLNFNWKTLLVICVVVLLGYWLFLGFVPLNEQIPTFERGPNNWANFIDSQLLGKHMWRQDYDPEGVISTLPSIVSCLIGVFVGKLINEFKSVRVLLGTSFILLVLGYVFNLCFPINKAIWSSSFVLVTSGWGTLVLAIIYYLIDVKQLRIGTVFKYVGMNAITLYFLSSLISKCMYLTNINNHNNVHSYFYNSVFVNDYITLKMSSLLYAITVVLFYIGLAYILFKRKIFIKV